MYLLKDKILTQLKLDILDVTCDTKLSETQFLPTLLYKATDNAEKKPVSWYYCSFSFDLAVLSFLHVTARWSPDQMICSLRAEITAADRHI